MKKALSDNGAVIKDDVILREIGREIMDYYYPNIEIKDNYLQVILSSGESVLARSTDKKKIVEVYTLGTLGEKVSNYRQFSIANGVLKRGIQVDKRQKIFLQSIYDMRP